MIFIEPHNACMAGCRRQSEPMLLLHAAELHGVDWAPDWPRNLRLWQCNCWNFAGMEHRTSACQKLGANIAKQATGNEPAMQEQNLPTGIAETRWELIENEKHMLPISKITSCSKPECTLWNQNYPCSHDSLPIIINACNACMAGCRRQSEPMLLLHAAELHGVDWAPDWPRNLRLWQCNCWHFTSMEHCSFACHKMGTNNAEPATGNEPAMHEQNWPTGIAKTRWELIENEKHMSPISKITSCSKPECKLWNQNYPCSHDSLPIIINACNAPIMRRRRRSHGWAC